MTLPLQWYAEDVAVVAAVGAEAVDLMQRLSSQDLRSLPVGGVCSALFVTHQGRLVARTRLWRGPAGLLLLCHPDEGQALHAWLERYTIMEDVSYRLLAERMPLVRVLASAPEDAALGAVASALQLPVPTAAADGQGTLLGEGWFAPQGACGGLLALPVPPAFGAGMDCLCAAETLSAVQAALAHNNAVALDTLAARRVRLLAGVPALQLDYPPQTAPLEYRLGTDSISWQKGCYIGQEVLSRLDSYDKVARLLMGVQTAAGALLWQHAVGPGKVLRDGQAIGRMCSMAPLPRNDADAAGDALVGLALLKRDAAHPGPVVLQWPTAEGLQSIPAQLHDRPFWQPR